MQVESQLETLFNSVNEILPELHSNKSDDEASEIAARLNRQKEEFQTIVTSGSPQIGAEVQESNSDDMHYSEQEPLNPTEDVPVINDENEDWACSIMISFIVGMFLVIFYAKI